MKSKPQASRSFNKLIFLNTAIFFLIMLLPSFLSFWACEEGTVTSGIWLWFAKFFYVLRFPFHTLFWKLITAVDGPLIFFSTLVLNCFFYGLLAERIVYLFKKRKMARQTNPEAKTDES